MCPFANVFV
jgi:hypothetical protein